MTVFYELTVTKVWDKDASPDGFLTDLDTFKNVPEGQGDKYHLLVHDEEIAIFKDKNLVVHGQNQHIQYETNIHIMKAYNLHYLRGGSFNIYKDNTFMWSQSGLQIPLASCVYGTMKEIDVSLDEVVGKFKCPICLFNSRTKVFS
jgi:hypothetical protein